MVKKYIDAEKLKAEITKHYNEYKTKFHQDGERYYWGLIDGIEITERIIDSLQQEQSAVIATPFIQTKPCEGQEMSVSSEEEQSCDTCTNDKGCVTCKDGELWEGKEQPSEDLESEIEKYFQGLWPGMETAEQCNTDMHFTPPAIMRLASHFYELGKNSKIK